MIRSRLLGHLSPYAILVAGACSAKEPSSRVAVLTSASAARAAPSAPASASASASPGEVASGRTSTSEGQPMLGPFDSAQAACASVRPAQAADAGPVEPCVRERRPVVAGSILEIAEGCAPCGVTNGMLASSNASFVLVRTARGWFAEPFTPASPFASGQLETDHLDVVNARADGKALVVYVRGSTLAGLGRGADAKDRKWFHQVSCRGDAETPRCDIRVPAFEETCPARGGPCEPRGMRPY